MIHDGYGLQKVIEYAFDKSSDSDILLPKYETEFHILLASFLQDITGTQRERMLTLIHILIIHPHGILGKIIPICRSDMNRIYLSGRNPLLRIFHILMSLRIMDMLVCH